MTVTVALSNPFTLNVIDVINAVNAEMDPNAVLTKAEKVANVKLILEEPGWASSDIAIMLMRAVEGRLRFALTLKILQPAQAEAVLNGNVARIMRNQKVKGAYTLAFIECVKLCEAAFEHERFLDNAVRMNAEADELRNEKESKDRLSRRVRTALYPPR